MVGGVGSAQRDQRNACVGQVDEAHLAEAPAVGQHTVTDFGAIDSRRNGSVYCIFGRVSCQSRVGLSSLYRFTSFGESHIICGGISCRRILSFIWLRLCLIAA